MSAADLRGGMPYADFLNAAIDDALESVRLHESRPSRTHIRAGMVAGLEACRGQDPAGLCALQERAAAERARLTSPAARSDDPAALAAYWHARAYEAQVAWICNVVHAAEDLSGRPTTYPTTARAGIMAARILDLDIPGL